MIDGNVIKRICVITSTRAEYGSLKWLMRGIDSEPGLKLQVVVAGAHLMKEQGNTIDEIINDGFSIERKLEVVFDNDTKQSIAASMGRFAIAVSESLTDLKPDFIVVLGDRYELLPICNTALVMGIPLIHIAGGDVTKGAIDDSIRNAVTMMATYHFPTTKDSADNIARMRGSKQNVWVVGALELDAINHEKLLSRDELADNIGLDPSKMWGLLTYHAETRASMDCNIDTTNNLLQAVSELRGVQTVATYSNTDYGGRAINEMLHKAEKSNPEVIKVIPSLGHTRYLSFMKQARFVIGNSSSGITQSPMLQIPSVNIGDRQNGRHQCSNVIQCGYKYEEISAALQKAIGMKGFSDDFGYWGEGHTSEKIIDIIKNKICGL